MITFAVEFSYIFYMEDAEIVLRGECRNNLVFYSVNLYDLGVELLMESVWNLATIQIVPSRSDNVELNNSFYFGISQSLGQTYHVLMDLHQNCCDWALYLRLVAWPSY
jgi:hypothetical protein